MYKNGEKIVVNFDLSSIYNTYEKFFYSLTEKGRAEMYINNDINYLEFLKVKTVYIFGAADKGKKCAYQLEKLGINIAGFIDNNDKMYEEKILEKPDLIIVDGGKGQIKSALEIIQLLNLDIYVCGLSKDDRHQTALLLNQEGEIVDIDRKSPLFYLLTRMQDEVHRYAISFHRQVRAKSLIDSILDDVEGIGPKRKRQLLNHFGSVKRMKEADLEMLKEVLPKQVAKSLYDRLHDND